MNHLNHSIPKSNIAQAAKGFIGTPDHSEPCGNPPGICVRRAHKFQHFASARWRLPGHGLPRATQAAESRRPSSHQGWLGGTLQRPWQHSPATGCSWSVAGHAPESFQPAMQSQQWLQKSHGIETAREKGGDRKGAWQGCGPGPPAGEATSATLKAGWPAEDPLAKGKKRTRTLVGCWTGAWGVLKEGPGGCWIEDASPSSESRIQRCPRRKRKSHLYSVSWKASMSSAQSLPKAFSFLIGHAAKKRKTQEPLLNLSALDRKMISNQ
jgi:hypothetical protein